MFVGYHNHLLRLNEGYEGTKGVFFRCMAVMPHKDVGAITPPRVFNLNTKKKK
jgi:hypothetical protein